MFCLTPLVFSLGWGLLSGGCKSAAWVPSRHPLTLGAKQCTQQFGVISKAVSASAIAADASGSIFMAGTTYGGLDGNTLTGDTDLFVAKYSTLGVKQ